MYNRKILQKGGCDDTQNDIVRQPFGERKKFGEGKIE